VKGKVSTAKNLGVIGIGAVAAIGAALAIGADGPAAGRILVSTALATGAVTAQFTAIAVTASIIPIIFSAVASVTCPAVTARIAVIAIGAAGVFYALNVGASVTRPAFAA
jgi:hypothetical protein